MSVFGVILTAYDTAANRFLRANEMDKEEKLHVSAKIPDRPSKFISRLVFMYKGLRSIDQIWL